MADSTPTPASIRQLLDQVETAFGSPVDTPLRFESLSDAVFRVTGTLLSVSTLKRIWGYVSHQSTPRHTTLDVLARFCGWTDFGTFASGAVRETESGPMNGTLLRPDVDVSPGESVILHWNPGRTCELEYDGNRTWHVVEATGTRLQPGDTFRCEVIIKGEPLYLSDLTRGGKNLGVYVCGRKSGVTFTLSHE